MRASHPILAILGVAVLGAACAPKSAEILAPGAVMPALPAESYDPPGSTVTTDRPVVPQARRTWTDPDAGLSVTNDYEGARLSDFIRTGEGTYRAHIRPENAPINHSPWYGFRLRADRPRSIEIELTYEDEVHRYVPKLSRDGTHWSPIAEADYGHDTAAGTARLRLDVGPEPLWVSAQERMNSAWYDAWIESLAVRHGVDVSEAGRSRLGQPIPMLSFGASGEVDGVVTVISRLHPPEVTGAKAMVRFVEALLADTDLARMYRERYRTLVIPIVNRDGVDAGHWRHNLGGVDLNRDWGQFNQPETRVVRDAFGEAVDALAAPVVFAIDFHSTQEDVFYTHLPEVEANRPGLVALWLRSIADALPGYEVNEEASGWAMIDAPTSKNWFFKRFGATSVTYEVGDEQDRALLDRISSAAAESLMRLLVVGGDGR